MIFDEMTTMRKLMLLHGVFDSKSIEEISTGNPLTFVTDLARPLKSLLIPFSPRQDGSGDPSPQNIRSILPWNGLKVFGGGKNLFDGQYIKGVVTGNSTQGYLLNTVTNANSAVIQCKGNTKYTVKKHSQSNRFSIATSEVEPENNTPLQLIIENQNLTEYTFTTSAKALYIVVYVSTGTEQATPELQCEVGQAATSYVPYIPITETDISFPSPVYGGTLDVVSGVLMVEWAKTILTGDSAENWRRFTNAESGNNFRFWTEALSDRLYANGVNGTQKSNYLAPTSGDTSSGSSGVITSIRQGITFFASGVRTYVYVPDLIPTENDVDGWCDYLALHPLEVCYKLATPQEITLTPEQITALVGNNTIWSDADGSMTAVYLKKG